MTMLLVFPDLVISGWRFQFDVEIGFATAWKDRVNLKHPSGWNTWATKLELLLLPLIPSYVQGAPCAVSTTTAMHKAAVEEQKNLEMVRVDSLFCPDNAYALSWFVISLWRLTDLQNTLTKLPQATWVWALTLH